MYIGLYCYNFRFTFCYITLREITELFSGIYQGDISARFQMERNSVFLTHAHVLSRNVKGIQYVTQKKQSHEIKTTQKKIPYPRILSNKLSFFTPDYTSNYKF